MKTIQCPKPFKITKPKVFDETGKEKEFTFAEFLINAVNNHQPFAKWPESRKGNKILDAIEAMEKSTVQPAVLTLEDDIYDALQAAVKAFQPQGVAYAMAADRAGFHEAVIEKAVKA